MAALHSYISKVSLSDFHFPKHHQNQSQSQSQSQPPRPHQMLSLCLVVVFVTTLSLLALSLSLIRTTLNNNNHQKKQRKTEHETPKPTHLPHDPTQPDPDGGSADLTRSAQSLLLERLFGAESEADSGRADPGGDGREGKRKKRRAKKKSSNSRGEEEEENENGVRVREKEELVCLYPFTSSSSVTQRKIKLQYDQLMKSHHSKGLTLTQVGQFANCLVEAKNELQHKADVIQRKFTITKALLFKADRSSFDRLRQQIYKLELEQKRLEEDAFVYNWLQQQLKLSPAYKKMLEIGARMELKAKSGELLESTDTEYSDISFEELLAQEKKDSFWQRNGKLRPCSG